MHRINNSDNAEKTSEQPNTGIVNLDLGMENRVRITK